MNAGECNTEIVCNGGTSCNDAMIDGATNFDITLDCTGVDSCKAAALRCGSGDCQLICNGATACEDLIVIGSAAAESFSCSGISIQSVNFNQSGYNYYQLYLFPQKPKVIVHGRQYHLILLALLSTEQLNSTYGAWD